MPSFKKETIRMLPEEIAFQKMFAPGKQPSDMDPIMLLSRWEKIFDAQFAAEMGKPTYPLIEAVYEAGIEYLNKIKVSKSAVDYGAPEGETENRAMVADALSHWYGTVPISAEDVVFTIGGAGGLDVSWDTLKKRNPKGKILIQEPWYPLHARDESELYPIDVMQEPGYRLTAALLERYITKAEKEGVQFRAVLLCDPNNPLGTCIGKEELKRIAVLLDERLPNVPVILDQAYCEMGLYSKHFSLVQVASEDLLDRTLILHSATKALSMAGERAAVAVIFNSSLRQQFVDLQVSRCGHAPKIIQYMYARALEVFYKNPKLQRELVQYYRLKVECVTQRVRQMGIALPDPDYKIDGGFYVPVDLQDLKGLPMPAKAVDVFGSGIKKTQHSEHITYKLLIETGIAIAPFANFSARLRKGQEDAAFMRITCSADLETLRAMMDRLEKYILKVRQEQYDQLTARLWDIIGRLVKAGVFDASSRRRLEKYTSIMQCPNKSIWEEARWMKHVNQALKKIINSSYAMLCSVDSKESALAAFEDQYSACVRKRQGLVNLFARKCGERQPVIEQTEALIMELEARGREINELCLQLQKRGIETDSQVQYGNHMLRLFRAAPSVGSQRRSRSLSRLHDMPRERALRARV